MYGLFPTEVEIRHFHLFCGMGGGAIGFNNGSARVGNLRARMRCVGGIDVDAQAIEDFNRRAGVPGTVLDLFDRAQYTAWHGHEPPADWREVTPDDIRKAVVGGKTPDIVFTSAPCKGFSGLQNPTRARTRKYIALNDLTVRGFWLMLKAFEHDPIPLIIMENVPKIRNSGPHLLDQIDALLECAGYAVAHTVHDAGELGGLGQRRKRFLLVARHKGKVPPFLYEAPRQAVRTVGDVLSELPLPECGPRIHQLPRITWKTWERLALVEAGKDWRSLQNLEIGEDGMVRGLRMLALDPAEISDPRADRDLARYQPYGVLEWGEPARVVTGKAAPGAGPYNVADPRTDRYSFPGTYGVRGWDDIAPTISSRGGPTNGAYSVADPRVPEGRADWRGPYGVTSFEARAHTVTGGAAPGSGTFSVADPRVPWTWGGRGKGRITRWDEPTGTIVARGSAAHTGAYAVADPRLADPDARRFSNVWRVGVWNEPAHTVTGARGGHAAIGDPRLDRDRFGNALRVAGWDETSPTVTSTRGGDQAIADPRIARVKHNNVFRVVRWDEASGTITGADGNARPNIADPRPVAWRDGKDTFQSAGNYGVVGWEEASRAVTASACQDNGFNSVADPRLPVYDPDDQPSPPPLIIALDGTFHRPFTTLELGALQGYPWQWLIEGIAGDADGAWRERIGNMVPPPAAQAIASTMAETLLMARAEVSMSLHGTSVWVRPLAIALSVEPASAFA